MKRIFYACLIGGMFACQQPSSQPVESLLPDDFFRVEGPDLITPEGKKLFIKGTNLGNWLNPEGYMFGFQKTNSGRFINEMFCQLVGPDFTAEFWKAFKDNYVTRKDIEFIASTGANTIRLPFHYKLFTDEDYMPDQELMRKAMMDFIENSKCANGIPQVGYIHSLGLEVVE